MIHNTTNYIINYFEYPTYLHKPEMLYYWQKSIKTNIYVLQSEDNPYILYDFTNFAQNNQIKQIDTYRHEIYYYDNYYITLVVDNKSCFYCENGDKIARYDYDTKTYIDIDYYVEYEDLWCHPIECKRYTKYANYMPIPPIPPIAQK